MSSLARHYHHQKLSIHTELRNSDHIDHRSMMKKTTTNSPNLKSVEWNQVMARAKLNVELLWPLATHHHYQEGEWQVMMVFIYSHTHTRHTPRSSLNDKVNCLHVSGRFHDWYFALLLLIMCLNLILEFNLFCFVHHSSVSWMFRLAWERLGRFQSPFIVHH